MLGTEAERGRQAGLTAPRRWAGRTLQGVPVLGVLGQPAERSGEHSDHSSRQGQPPRRPPSTPREARSAAPALLSQGDPGLEWTLCLPLPMTEGGY